MSKNNTKADNPQLTLADAPQVHAYTASDGKSYEVSLAEQEIWMNQKDMAKLFGTSIPNINMHIKAVIEADKLPDSVIQKSLITASDGKSYEVKFYNLQVIIPVGFRVNSQEATRFRAWVNNIIEKYLTIGVVINEPLLESRAILKDQQTVDKHERANLGHAPEIMHLKAELSVKCSLKNLNDMIAKVVVNPNYGTLHNAKLEALFGLKSKQIQALLNSKNIHEGLPTMQLEYIDFAHKQIIHILQMQADGIVTNERAVAGIEMAVKPLGDYLRNLCEQLGIDHISGKPLLTGGKGK